ncbi:MAG: hypothetical protein ACFB8W_07640 [Elainellaceae cyanobacterium]
MGWFGGGDRWRLERSQACLAGEGWGRSLEMWGDRIQHGEVWNGGYHLAKMKGRSLLPWASTYVVCNLYCS